MISINDLPQEFFVALADLETVFQPENFHSYENDPAARNRLVQNLRPFIAKLYELVPMTQPPDFEILRSLPDTLSQDELITLLFFYLRLSVSQGGGEAFIRLWKNRTALTLVKRLLQCVDAKRYPAVTLLSDSVFLGARWCCYKLEAPYDFVDFFASRSPFPPVLKCVTMQMWVCVGFLKIFSASKSITNGISRTSRNVGSFPLPGLT